MATRTEEIREKTYMPSVFLSFIPVLSIFLLYIGMNQLISFSNYYPGTFIYLSFLASLFILSNIISFSVLNSFMIFSIYWRSCLLSNGFLIGFMIANQNYSPNLVSFGYYLMVLSVFHMSEFVFTALYNSKEVTTDSFLLNHSMEYGLAALASWLEFFIELLLFPSLKGNLYVRCIGMMFILFGELFRKLAMYTAGKNFNHYVQERKQDDHVLVTKGVYSIVRHPSYFGWFYWSIGTQILLANPICTILYTIASWKFFKARITFEEYHLLRFFGKQYILYQQRVRTGIPFVDGYILKEESLD
jgi:protein-S-isoprenylcysteine O-methyltransferase